MLGRHLLVRRQQDDVVEPPAGPVHVVAELQDVGVHQERLAGTGRALKGEGAQVVRLIIRHGRGQPIFGFGRVQVGAQPFGIVEIARQVVLGEQHGEILIRLPCPPVLTGHAQPAAVRGNIGVVCGKLLASDGGKIRVQIQRPGVFALPDGVKGGRHLPQPVQHGPHVLVAKFPANKAVQNETIAEGRHSRMWLLLLPSPWRERAKVRGKKREFCKRYPDGRGLIVVGRGNLQAMARRGLIRCATRLPTLISATRSSNVFCRFNQNSGVVSR